MLKILTVVGTRPELIKMSSVVRTLAKSTNHVLVHTGQNYDPHLNDIFYDDLELDKPDYYLDVASGSPSAACTIGNILRKTDEVFSIEKPDAVLLYGDTNSCLSIIAAKKRKIPIFHMEAGNRCFDQRVPEEINRKIVDHLADVNLCLTEHARRYLIAEGIPQDRIFVTGSHLDEVISSLLPKIDLCPIVAQCNLRKDDFFVVSMHREENVDNVGNLGQIKSMLVLLSQVYKKRILVSLHPRTRSSLLSFGLKLDDIDGVSLLNPLGIVEYLSLVKDCYCWITDSGTIAEESRILGIPAITPRYIHERPEGIETGSFTLFSGFNLSNLEPIVESARKLATRETRLEFSNLNLSHRISSIVLGYAGYISNHTWRA